MEYFIKHMMQLDSPKNKPKNNQQLTVGEFDNTAACLQLTETLLSGCTMQKEIQNVIINIPGVARASSLLIKHLHDDGM